jgi:hypothetical protein
MVSPISFAEQSGRNSEKPFIDSGACVALENPGIDYVLSGSPATNMWVSSAPDAEAVLYVSDIGDAQIVLWELGNARNGQDLFLLPFNGVSEQRRQTVEGVSLASLTQIVIDCLGLTGRQPARAEAIVDNWTVAG